LHFATLHYHMGCYRLHLTMASCGGRWATNSSKSQYQYPRAETNGEACRLRDAFFRGRAHLPRLQCLWLRGSCLTKQIPAFVQRECGAIRGTQRTRSNTTFLFGPPSVPNACLRCSLCTPCSPLLGILADLIRSCAIWSIDPACHGRAVPRTETRSVYKHNLLYWAWHVNTILCIISNKPKFSAF